VNGDHAGGQHENESKQFLHREIAAIQVNERQANDSRHIIGFLLHDGFEKRRIHKSVNADRDKKRPDVKTNPLQQLFLRNGKGRGYLQDHEEGQERSDLYQEIQGDSAPGIICQIERIAEIEQENTQDNRDFRTDPFPFGAGRKNVQDQQHDACSLVHTFKTRYIIQDYPKNQRKREEVKKVGMSDFLNQHLHLFLFLIGQNYDVFFISVMKDSTIYDFSCFFNGFEYLKDPGKGRQQCARIQHVFE
jgi:hypothetical protein